MTETSQLLIALSAGGVNEELAEQGLGEEHVQELMVRLSRKLLFKGHRLAFGGTVGHSDHPLTELLIGAALGWLNEEAAKASDVNDPSTWPLRNYAAWPFDKIITPEHKAQLVGVCNFKGVSPPGVNEDDLEGLHVCWEDKPRARYVAADALSAMRERLAKETDMRIVWGGRIKGSIGWMAGILEEVSFSLRERQAVLILGGFGGCAARLADFLRDLDAPWPQDLSLAGSAHSGRDDLLTVEERDRLLKRLEEAQELLQNFRVQIHKGKPVNKIPAALILKGLDVGSPRPAINIALKAVRKVRHQLDREGS